MTDAFVYQPREHVLAAVCPVCQGMVDLSDPLVGMLIECPDCEEPLEVIDLTPLTLAAAADPDEVPFPDEDERRE